MRRHLLVAVLLTVVATVACAQEPPSPEGGSAFPPVDVPESEADGITNWWSWDYGPSAKDPQHKHLPPPFGYALINFGIFCAILYKLAANPLRSFVRDRHDQIRKDLDEAARLHREAKARLAEYEKKVAGADAEIDKVVSDIRKEAEAEKTRAIAAAEAQAQRLKADAERQIAAEIERARIELRRGVVEAAVAAAEGILRQQIGADDQRRLAESFVAGLEQTAPSSAKRPS